MKVCLIDQSCGLGDILLSIKIGCEYARKGYRVIWPIEPVYKNLQQKIAAKNNIEFPCVDDDFDFKDTYNILKNSEIPDPYQINEVLCLPLRRSFHSHAGRKMEAMGESHDACNMLGKFAACGLHHNNWQDYFEIKRDTERENQLIEVLKIGKKFHFVNKLFGTPPRWKEKLNQEIETPKHLQRIEMDFIKGFDIFDWISVFERAAKIDSVSTSTFYFFEKISLNCTPTKYCRNTNFRSFDENFNWLKAFAKKQYNFIC